MKTQFFSLQKLGLGTVVTLFAVFAFAASAQANSYYYQPVSVPYYYSPYQSTSYDNRAALSAYLQQLQTHLAELLKNYQNKYGHNYNYGYGLGSRVSYRESWNDYDIDVDTEKASSIGDDRATLYGEVDLEDASYAKVWFEYGQNGRLNDESDSRKVKDSGSDRFSIKIDDLDEDEKYYYRAIAEDPEGVRAYGMIKSFETDGSSSSNDDEPEAETDEVDDVDDDSAELTGEVDMNDFNNGRVFFVYGEDEDQIDDVASDYDTYSDVDEDGDDLQKVLVDNDLDSSDSYTEEVFGLDEDEDYFYQICVEYEDDDDDDVLECGGVEEFTTGGNSNDDEPEVDTNEADDIDDDSAELNGEVDMNDFDNGTVFFVYGEDEDAVEDVEDEDSYSDIDEDGDDLQKEEVEDNFDGSDNFSLDIYSLDDNTDHYYRICVEYEDEDNDDTLECGDVEDFETDY